MNRARIMTFVFVMCASMLISAHHAARACQVDEFFNTREGFLAATVPETLNTAAKYDEEGNKKDLAELLGNGSVLRLQGNVKVQVLERSVEFKMLKMKFLDKGDTYWVKEGALKPIHCN
jgi:hypothetical protein